MWEELAGVKKHLFFFRGSRPGFGETDSSLSIHYNYQKGPAYSVGLVACLTLKEKAKYFHVYDKEFPPLKTGVVPVVNNDVCDIRCVGLGSTSPSAKCCEMESCAWERPWHRSLLTSL